MVKRIKKITKGKPTRERRKVIVVGTEGRNRTEILYLRSLEKKQSIYHFIFAEGNETDPLSIVRNTVRKAQKEDLSNKRGDFAVSIFDLDLDSTKVNQLLAAKDLSSKKNVRLITSNPCFEIWYLEHFGYTSKPFVSSDEVIQQLKKYIPDYSKSTDCFEILFPHTAEAVENCSHLEEYHKGNGSNGIFEYNNPRTDMYKLVEAVMQ